ncbi:hypothetical protein JMK10_07310 [Rhodovulum sulfidophilum]|uniref:hypothetical protein n=1 Tax=Rhodovulum sulfidophilum TaxID=35806 RepID=UPI0019214C59|nr:hypothetical protein [Rhodovulum sulfidophilum]MBL3572542.1 hypothetical protein [Rhodovulum sulfidophilum]MCE8432108.1 hypothetical protein [Rhodovulum sulfidophilum]MCF4116619.1 hypothetical protein [Rhodovulum sulfidophilum]
MTGFANEMSPASASSGPDSAAAATDATVEPRPTHLLTMSRGAPEAVPASAMRVLRAMGVEAVMMPGEGVGLTFRREIPNFLRLDPFRLTDLAPAPAAEDEAEVGPDAPGLEAGMPEEAAETAPVGDADETAGMPDEIAADAAAEDELSDPGLPMPEEAEDEAAAETVFAEDDAADLDSAEGQDVDAPDTEASLADPTPEAGAEEELPNAPEPETGDETATGLADLSEEAGPGPDIGLGEDDILPDMPEAELEAEDDLAASDSPDIAALDETENESPDDTAELEEASDETFGAALDRVMDRLDLIEFMLGSPRDDLGDADPGESLGTRIATIEAAMARVEDNQQRLAEGLERVEAAVARIEAALDTLAQPSTAPEDDTDSSQAAIEAIEERIEAIAERLGDVQSSHSGEIAALLERIERLAEAQPEGSVSADDIAARAIEIDALSSLVTALSEQLMAGQGEERQGNLDAVLDRLNATQESIAAMVSQLLEGSSEAERRFGA